MNKIKKIILIFLLITSNLFAQSISTRIRSKNWKERKSAVENILDSEIEDKIDLLRSVLNDKKEDVRIAAVKEIIKIGGNDVIIPLTEALKDEKEYIRSTALAGLITIGEEASDSIGFALKDPAVRIRKTALEAIADMDDRIALKYLDGALSDSIMNIRDIAIDGIYNIVKRSTESLSKPEVLKLLGKAIKDREKDLRIKALQHLISIGGIDTLEVIGIALDDTDPGIRGKAIDGIHSVVDKSTDSLGKPIKLKLLSRAIKDREKDLRIKALQHVASMGGIDTLEVIGIALDDTDPGIRGKAVDGIYNAVDKSTDSLGNPIKLKLLEKAMSDKERKLRIKAARYVSAIGDDQAVEILGKGLENRDAKTRMEIVRELGDIGGDIVVPHLVKSLSDTEFDIRIESLETLKKIPTPKALKAIASGIDDRNFKIRDMIVRILAIRGDSTVIDELGKALADRDWRIRVSAVYALASIGNDKAVDKIAKALKDRDKEVKGAAINMLKVLKNPRCVDKLGKQLIEDRRFRIKVAEALGEIKDRKALKYLLKVVTKEKDEVKESLETAIQKIIESNKK